MTPISPEQCIGGRDLTEPQLSPDGSMLAYVMGGVGGAALMLSRLDGSPTRQLSTYPQPRAGRGLGGGCFCWAPDSMAIAYAGGDGQLWWQPVPGGQVRRLTDHDAEHVAQAPVITPDATAIVYVLDQAEVWLQPLNGATARRLDDASNDFCFDPAVSPDSATVTWQAWSVPDMPWDGSRLVSRQLVGDTIEVHTCTGAAQQPRYLPNGALMCVRDDSGWNNVWLDDAALIEEPFEHGGPSWGLGQRSFAVSPDGAQVAFTRNERGFGRLCVTDVATGTLREVARGVHGQLSWRGTRLAAIRTGARTPTQVVVYDTTTWDRTVVEVGPVSGWESESLAEPEPLEVIAADGNTLYARLYRADEPTDRLLCWLHGGPTDQWQVTFMPRLAFWRSRGWNVLVPDHRGSTGHGRAYQQAARGGWGVIDVSDIVRCARRGSCQRMGILGAHRADGWIRWWLHRPRRVGPVASTRGRGRGVVSGHRPHRSGGAEPSIRTPLHDVTRWSGTGRRRCDRSVSRSIARQLCRTHPHTVVDVPRRCRSGGTHRAEPRVRRRESWSPAGWCNCANTSAKVTASGNP